MFACNGILFNHESPLRGETLVTRKITRAAAKIALGLQDTLFLGNLNSTRDWGHAKDYVEGMWRILQQEVAEDFVLATGVTTSIRDFVKIAFQNAGIELEFRGSNEEETAVVRSCREECKIAVGTTVVKVDPRYYRPTEVELLIGDATKAREKLSWTPVYTMEKLAEEMVAADLELFKREVLLKQSGYKIINQFE